MKKTAIVYWLIPAKPKRELFSEIIRILARQLDAARFEPHLTVLAARQDREPPGKILRQINVSPIRLKVRVAHSRGFGPMWDDLPQRADLWPHSLRRT